jgi:hypothetical protein
VERLMSVLVRCFRVLIHGRFERLVRLGPADVQTRGFYTTRWVVAGTNDGATRKAFASAKRELQQWADIRDGLVGIDMEAEDVSAGSWWRWLRGGGKGFAFYFDD